MLEAINDSKQWVLFCADNSTLRDRALVEEAVEKGLGNRKLYIRKNRNFHEFMHTNGRFSGKTLVEDSTAEFLRMQ